MFHGLVLHHIIQANIFFSARTSQIKVEHILDQIQVLKKQIKDNVKGVKYFGLYFKGSVCIFCLHVYFSLSKLSSITYNIGGQHTYLSRRIPGCESQYENHLYFPHIFLLVVLYILSTGEHTPFTLIKRKNPDPRTYIDLLTDLHIYPPHYSHLRHTMYIELFQKLQYY